MTKYDHCQCQKLRSFGRASTHVSYNASDTTNICGLSCYFAVLNEYSTLNYTLQLLTIKIAWLKAISIYEVKVSYTGDVCKSLYSCVWMLGSNFWDILNIPTLMFCAEALMHSSNILFCLSKCLLRQMNPHHLHRINWPRLIRGFIRVLLLTACADPVTLSVPQPVTPSLC